MHGGGTKHVTLRRFEPYRPSCTNLTPTRATASGSALLFWLCSFRILPPTTIPLSPPRSEQSEPYGMVKLLNLRGRGQH